MAPDHNTRPAASAWSLFQSLSDGSAGAVARLIVSLAGGLFLAALASVMSYALSATLPAVTTLMPVPGGAQMRSYTRVSEEVALVCFLFAAVAYMILLYWIWSRHRRQRAIWLGGILTVGIWILAIVLCAIVDSAFVGEDEFLIAGIVCAAGAATLIVWLVLFQQYTRGRSLYDETGIVDLRCPACQYHMAGLKEARCPECGQEYTLDELVGKQDFEALRRARPGLPHVSPPPIPRV